MKRNMDLVRDLLLQLEAVGDAHSIHIFTEDDHSPLKFDGHTWDEVEYHARQLIDAGIINNGNVNPMVGFCFKKITWYGHDFVDSIRDSEIWEKTKSTASATGSYTIEVVLEIAKAIIKNKIKVLTGMDI